MLTCEVAEWTQQKLVEAISWNTSWVMRADRRLAQPRLWSASSQLGQHSQSYQLLLQASFWLQRFCSASFWASPAILACWMQRKIKKIYIYIWNGFISFFFFKLGFILHTCYINVWLNYTTVRIGHCFATDMEGRYQLLAHGDEGGKD